MVQVEHKLGTWKVVQVQQGLDLRYLNLILILKKVLVVARSVITNL